MNRKIMAVDDDPNQLELVNLLLQEEGFTIETACNGVDALDKVYRFRPDLILVDASMPKMNGFTLCDRLRKNPESAGIPILMITGMRSDFTRLNSFAHGANAFLLKPYKADELILTVNELLREPGHATAITAARP